MQTLCLDVSAQIFSGTKTEKYKGEVKVSGGDLLKGTIELNLAIDAVQIEVDESGELLAFTASKLDYFKFNDDEVEKERVFYSLPYITESSGYESFLFFELIKDAGEFALLSRVHFKETKTGGSWSGGTPTTITTPDGGTTTFYGTPAFTPGNDVKIEYEHLYFITKEGEILPYGIVKGYKNNLALGTITFKSKVFIDKDALRKVMEDHYKDCMEYANKEKLNIKKVKDLLVVMDYFKDLL